MLEEILTCNISHTQIFTRSIYHKFLLECIDVEIQEKSSQVYLEGIDIIDSENREIFWFQVALLLKISKLISHLVDSNRKFIYILISLGNGTMDDKLAFICNV